MGAKRRSSCGSRGARNCKTSTSTTTKALKTWWVEGEKPARTASRCGRGLGLGPLFGGAPDDGRCCMGAVHCGRRGRSAVGPMPAHSSWMSGEPALGAREADARQDARQDARPLSQHLSAFRRCNLAPRERQSGQERGWPEPRAICNCPSHH